MQQGYHWLKLSSSMFPEHGAAFKRWQSETKVDVAISRDDLPAMLRPLPTARFLPTLMMVPEPFRPAQLLVTRPTGKPDVAPLIDFDWGQVDRDLSRMVANHSVNEGAKAQLSQWISERPKTMAEASALPSLPRHDARPLRPAFGGMTGGHAVIGRTAAMRAAVRVEGQNRIVNSRVEANALAAENAVNRAARDEVCEFLQCTVLGKHGAVSDDVTLRGRDVIFFLKQAKIISRCRYVPGMPRPGVSK